jgi:lipopolysaccharide transport system ATP-binding protein
MKPILEIQNISKKFIINHEQQSYLSLRDSITGILKKRSVKEDFWALKDVSFDVMPGDTIGIIGKNGAGKSTLLKILSKITPPTNGKIIGRGRIASLLEVGTGFHAELSGRENVFMNGSILGMKRSEIIKNFDAIVDFAGIEKFIDTPLKHYSSGMQLRLAFAVAAFLENEILIIDEVLAVGDAEFQKKCMGKMEDVSRNQGRTVLFVSHNLPSLKTVCEKGVLLKSGKVLSYDKMESIINLYNDNSNSKNQTIIEGLKYFHKHIKVRSVIINGIDRNHIVLQENKLVVEIDMDINIATNYELDIHIKKDDVFILSYANFVKNQVIFFEEGRYKFRYEMLIPDLKSGLYKIDLYFTEPFKNWYCVSDGFINLEVINEHNLFLNNSHLNWGSVLLDGVCSYENIND